MSKYAGSAAKLRIFLSSILVTGSVFFLSKSVGASAFDSKIFRGESVYLEAFEEFSKTDSLADRLVKIAPLARAAFVEGRVMELLGKIDRNSDENRLIRAAVLQFFGDIRGASEEIGRIDSDSELQESLLEQKRIWALEENDFETLLPIVRRTEAEGFDSEPDPEYVQALFETSGKEELFGYLESRRGKLIEEADFWRSRFPEFSKRDCLKEAAKIFISEWEKGDEPALFALGELHFFLGEIETAKSLFWQVFESEESVENENYFRRLNRFFHDRFAVKHRIGEATGRYGSRAGRQYAFFGLRHDLEVKDLAAARDASLNYLREIDLGGKTSREFLERVRDGFEKTEHSFALRILAFAQAGAPGRMLDEIEEFADFSEMDSETIQFALLSINRFVLSTEKFPEIRDRMGDLAVKLVQKLEEGNPDEATEQIRELRERILRRLGLSEVFAEKKEADSLYLQLQRQIEERKLIEAEKTFRILQKSERTSPALLLSLARIWLESGDFRKGGLFLSEFFHQFYGIDSRLKVVPPLSWSEASQYLPNFWHGEQQQELLNQGFQLLASFEGVQPILEEEWEKLSPDKRSGAWIVRAHFYLFADGRKELTDLARRGLELPESELNLFAAWILGFAGEVDEAKGSLRKMISDDSDFAMRAGRLLFALAVLESDKETAVDQLALLNRGELSSGEKVRVAGGLQRLGENQLALEWLDRVELSDLYETDRRSFQSLLLRATKAESKEKAVALAHSILLSEFPESFYQLSRPVRKEALELLAEQGELDLYEENLKAVAGFAKNSVSLHLLLGEAAEFKNNLEQARENFLRIDSILPKEPELKMELAEWLSENRFFDDSIAIYQRLLENHAEAVLLDLKPLLRVFRESDRFELLIDFFEKWRMPEAESLDQFYGLQPTAHIFEQIGEELLKTGKADSAARAWRIGLKLNPIEFTDEMRVALAKIEYQKERKSDLIDLIIGYADEENSDPEIYFHQPFATVLPRWIANRINREEMSFIDQLLEIAEKADVLDDLADSIDRLSRENPENFSISVFGGWLSFWRGELSSKEIRSRFEKQFGGGRDPLEAAWRRAEVLFEG